MTLTQSPGESHHRNDEARAQFAIAVRDALGIELESGKLSSLERRFNELAQELGHPTVDGWLSEVAKRGMTPAERAVLARFVTISETYFFREPGAFRSVASVLIPAWLQSRKQGPFR